MGQLEDMHVYIRVVESGSITEAASQLNLAKSAVSKRLSDLENRLGAKLINRTTRTSSLTEAGQQYYLRVKQLVGQVESINGDIASKNKVLSGSLKIAVPLSFGITHLTPAIGLFMRKHPDLAIELDYSDHKVDLVEGGYDLAFRIGYLPDSSLKARKITPINAMICASPDYLAQYGTPTNPTQMSQHKVLKQKSWPLAGIPLTDGLGKKHMFTGESHLTSNNGDAMMKFAIAGHGIICLPTFFVWEAIKKGDLVALLQDYSIATMHAYAVYPATDYLPAKVRGFVDFLVDHFGDTPYWDS